ASHLHGPPRAHAARANWRHIMLRSRSLLGFGVVGALSVVAFAQNEPPSEPPAQPPAAPPEAQPTHTATPPAAADASVTKAPAKPATATIKGRVLAKNGEPIPGAVITLGNYSAISDGE